MKTLGARIFHSLHFKIAAGVILTILVLSATYFVADYRYYRQQLLGELRKSAKDVSSVTLNSLLELSMLGEHPELLQRAVEALPNDAAVDSIQILDLKGVIRFGSNPADVGLVMDRQDAGCAPCHSNETVVPRSAFIELGGREVLRRAEPIPNRPECHTCHNSNEFLLGLLIVDFPTEVMHSELRSSLYEMLLQAGLTVLAILIVLGALMNQVVILPIKKLTGATTRFTEKSVPPELDSLIGKDEIGKLAHSFKEMALRLRKRYEELEEKERIRIRLVDRLVHSQEEERRVISRDLHDQFGQSLSALLLALQQKAEAQGNEHILSIESYRDLEHRIRELIDDVHQLAWQMRPSILDDYGLEMALERYIEELAKTTPIQIDYQHFSSNQGQRLPSWLEITLYRVAQESLNNVIRHSAAKRASVIVMKDRTAVTLIIEDDGKGFDPDSVKPGIDHGLGLLGMRERVAQCQGTLDIESAHLKGTTIRVKIPSEQISKWQSESS
ncbi:MAG: HAMP domain-containing protein [Acidobacteriota bacterium]|nr:MAG: HAMP domain-containing protein [Acidobacteriota bacterium]